MPNVPALRVLDASPAVLNLTPYDFESLARNATGSLFNKALFRILPLLPLNPILMIGTPIARPSATTTYEKLLNVPTGVCSSTDCVYEHDRSDEVPSVDSWSTSTVIHSKNIVKTRMKTLPLGESFTTMLRNRIPVGQKRKSGMLTALKTTNSIQCIPLDNSMAR